MSRSSDAVPLLTVKVRLLLPSARLPLMVADAVEAFVVILPPSVRVPVPVVALPPVRVSAPMVSELLLRSRSPEPTMVTVLVGI